MSELSKMKCVPCRGGEPPLEQKMIWELHPQVPDWEIKERNGVKRLEREFVFKNFEEALAFTDEIGVIAEEEGHHPVGESQGILVDP